MNSEFPEMETVLDEWVQLRKTTLRTRKLNDSMILKLYTPPHTTLDSLTPLQWRKRILTEKISGTVIDTDMKNGAALLGIGSCKNIKYIGVIYNYRHRQSFERLIRIFGIHAELFPTIQDIPSSLRNSAIYIR